jgi:hypothetical protein
MISTIIKEELEVEVGVEVEGGMVGVTWITLPSKPTIRDLYSDEHWSGYHIAYNPTPSPFVAPLQGIWHLEH